MLPPYHLSTKLYIPPLRPKLVARTRLTEQLTTGLGSKLTLVSAPAGFGKTTLLCEWAYTLQVERTPPLQIAWASLDADDDNPIRFWTYFVTALRTVQPAVGMAALAALQSPDPPSMETLLTEVINEMMAILPLSPQQHTRNLILILDDFHTIVNTEISEALLFFLENLPPQMHLILASRADPPWPLARLRARDEITELRAADLRFTLGEVTEFLNNVMGLSLSATDIATLDARTEGWVASLQLAALSMRGHQDTTSFIKAFSGSHHFILDYLVEEVLEQQAPEIQEFLLKTAILDRLTGSLCDAVTGRDDSREILVHLDQENLFLVPLDNARYWYRYHHLFADLLRSRLELADPDQVCEQHSKVSQWFEENELLTDAVSHALLANDIERVAHLVKKSTLSLIYHGHMHTLLDWLSALSAETIRSRPWLCIAQAWILAYSGEIDRVEPVLLTAERRSLSSNGESSPDASRRHLLGHIAAIRGYCALFQNNELFAEETSRQALDLLPEDDLVARGFATILCGIAVGYNSSLVAGSQLLVQAIDICQAAGDPLLEMMALCDLSYLQREQGQLHNSASSCHRALELADAYAWRSGLQSPLVGFVYSRLSAVSYERNDLKDAIRYAREATELGRHWGQKDSLLISNRNLARALHATGDSEGAAQAIQRAKRLGREFSPWQMVGLLAMEARFLLEDGQLDAAADRIRESGVDIDSEISLANASAHCTLAWILIAQGKTDQAMVLLHRLLEAAEAVGSRLTVIEVLLLQALAHQARGSTDQALEHMRRALALAEPEGIVRVFVNKGTAMARLLQQAAENGILPEYAHRLLKTMDSPPLSGQMARSRVDKPSPLKPAHQTESAIVGSISTREMEVLQLLTTHLSTPQIAQELFISSSTVRSHIKSIYRKLDAHNRMEAIQRAAELGLL